MTNDAALPEWLTGLQAVTWLVTNDIERTANARPKATTAPKLMSRPAAIPIEDWRLLRKRLAKERRAVWAWAKEFCEPLKRPTKGAPLSQAERRAIIGDSDWGGLPPTDLLAMEIGNRAPVEEAIALLVSAARNGSIATCDQYDHRISTAAWALSTLHPDTLEIAPR